jgi:hypothetical protein
MPRKFKDMVENIIVQDDGRKGFTLLDEDFNTLDLNVLSEICTIIFREDGHGTRVKDYVIIETAPSAIGFDADNFGLYEIAVVYNMTSLSDGSVYEQTNLSFSIKIQLYVLAVSKNITLEMYQELVKEDPYNSDLYNKVILLNKNIGEDLYLYVRL